MSDSGWLTRWPHILFASAMSHCWSPWDRWAVVTSPEHFSGDTTPLSQMILILCPVELLTC